MRKRLIGLLIAGSVAAVPVAAPTAAPAKTPPAVTAKSCSPGYVHGIINGAHKCLRRGEFCTRSAKGQYRQYGYNCRFDGSYWRLV